MTRARRGHDHEVILSSGFWQREFGGARDVIGQKTHLSGEESADRRRHAGGLQVLDDDIDIYAPASFTAQEKSDQARHSNNWNMIGLLNPGVPIERAKAEVDAINLRNDRRFPQFHQVLIDAGFDTAVNRLQDDVVQDVRAVLLLLWGGVLFVLLIGCLNIANLVLVRESSGRTRELATRQAVGAGVAVSLASRRRTRLLAVVGGGVGLGLGWWALKLVPGSVSTACRAGTTSRSIRGASPSSSRSPSSPGSSSARCRCEAVAARRQRRDSRRGPRRHGLPQHDAAATRARDGAGDDGVRAAHRRGPAGGQLPEGAPSRSRLLAERCRHWLIRCRRRPTTPRRSFRSRSGCSWRCARCLASKPPASRPPCRSAATTAIGDAR